MTTKKDSARVERLIGLARGNAYTLNKNGEKDRAEEWDEAAKDALAEVKALVDENRRLKEKVLACALMAEQIRNALKAV